MIMLRSPDPRTERARRLAICLALIAGYVDAYSISAFHTYVSFMSGNTTQLGVLTGQGQLALALAPVLAIVFFVAGAFAGTLLTGRRQLLFGLVSTLLAVVIGLTKLGALDAAVGIGTLSLAMGIMNAALTKVGGEGVSITFMTGDLFRIGSHLALAVRRAPLPDAQGPWDTHRRRAARLGIIWVGFLAGAVFSAVAASYFGVLALLPPVVILLALALLLPRNTPTKAQQPIREPEREIKPALHAEA
jgi:uncharacterized membrane protein YoaK (UPF0700 family)